MLEHLTDSAAGCEVDSAVFVCSSNRGIICWKITLPGRNVSLSWSFSQFFSDPQAQYGPGSSVITGNVTYVNTTFIISTVIFYRAIHLNNSILNCNNDIITYTIETSKIYSILTNS